MVEAIRPHAIQKLPEFLVLRLRVTRELDWLPGALGMSSVWRFNLPA